MDKTALIELLQQDLKNERKHMAFYLHSASMVCGLHREEFREFFLKEAQSEMHHVQEFADFLVFLGAIPNNEVNSYPTHLQTPEEILDYVIKMEQEVADIYAVRLNQTHEMEDATVAYAHVFYEDQIKDSQATAWEIAQWKRTKPLFVI